MTILQSIRVARAPEVAFRVFKEEIDRGNVALARYVNRASAV
jgi:hypothetical protein